MNETWFFNKCIIDNDVIFRQEIDVLIHLLKIKDLRLAFATGYL